MNRLLLRYECVFDIGIPCSVQKGYSEPVTIDENVKKQLYKVDENDDLGTIQFKGQAKTLADLINMH